MSGTRVSETLRSELLGTAGLTVAVIVATGLTYSRRLEAGHLRAGNARATFIALIALQALHFTEEYAAGFHERFPAFLGLAPWPATFFVPFNVIWLGIWVGAALGLRAGYQLALFPAWFLAIASVANGIAHPVLALATRGYFPGLWTSPLLAAGGMLLWRRLMTITARA
ncbi:MAG TPA: HXXEE domain-containing protein [Vicinamibacterales bacterium]|nr:HXXEE domain-containing protein [Vicinamibacterales bacterium]